MSTGVTVKEYRFLQGGGEMGALTRAKDWGNTSLGPVENWPQSLRTTLSILLHSKFPMFLFWGDELTCFYNDAYRPSLGKEGKHPGILGMAGEKAWPEIWTIIKPLIDQVLAGGEATWSADQLIPIYRNGKLEDVYWTFSYSPVADETGKVAGVFVTCTETTSQVKSQQQILQSERNFRTLIEESPVAAAVLRGKDFIIELANETSIQLWGKTRGIIGKKVIEAFPELMNEQHMQLLRDVFETGIGYEGKEDAVQLMKNGQPQTVYINFIYRALSDESGNISGILCMSYDVTGEVEAKKQLTELEERTRLAVDANEIGIYDANLLTGEVVFSEKMHQLYGFNHPIPKEFYISMIHPDDLEVRKQAHEKAKQTGKLQYQYRVILQDGSVRWIDSHAKLYYNSKGLPYRRIGTIQDITALKNLVEKIGETEKKFRNTVMQAPVGILLTNGPQFVVEMVNEAYLQLVDRKEDDFTGKPLFESLPEVREAVEPLLLEVLNTGISYHGNEFDVTLNRFGKKEIAYFNFVYQPLRGQNGSISGVMVIASEVTKQVTTRFALQESREQFSKMVMQSPIAMTIWRGPDLIIEIANNALMENIWRKKPEEVIGKKALDVFPELVDQKYPALLGNVMATGIAHREKESVAYVQGNDGVKKFYLDVEYAPLYENDGTVSGVMITVNDVTERVEVRRQFQAAEERLRLAAEGTGLATWDLDIATRAIIYSPRLATIFGHSESAQLTHTQLRERIIEQDRRTIVEPAFEQALETGFYFYEARVLHPDNIIRWARMQGKVVYDENQQPVRMLGTALDVTEDKVNEEKLQRLAAIVQTSGDAIISKTIDGIITSWNDAAARMFNYTADEIIGQSILKLVPEEKKEEEAGIVERLKKGERIKPFESHGMTKEKKLIDISLTVSPLKGPRGQIVGASKIIRDITTQKEAERRINESEQKFRLLADSMPQFIWTSDPGGELNYFSKTMYDYSGLGPAAMEGKGWLQIVHPDDRPANIKQWLHCIKTGEPFLFEHRFRRYDGEYRWQLSRAVPQKDKKGKIQMWVGTSTDIDEIKKHDQQKDDFIKMASHELKTPVTTIKGYIQLLLKMNSGGDDPFLAGTLLTIDKQIYKLTKLITDLLDVTKIETGSLELNRETFFIADTVKEIAAELEITNQTHTIDIHQHANPVVYADRDRIAQVFTNLFTNAIKYSPRSNTIIVNISREENNVLISIKDFGIGISREDLARIFERFYRAAGKDEKTFPGFGIGLFIVNEIVSLHNGKVWAESEKDKGTIFYVLLPVRD